jgi:hypothetical protein
MSLDQGYGAKTEQIYAPNGPLLAPRHVFSPFFAHARTAEATQPTHVRVFSRNNTVFG